MSDSDATPSTPRPATSEDIPRAVEFLIQFVLRRLLFSAAGVFGLLAMIAIFLAWTLWVLIPAVVLSLGAFFLGLSIKPRGKLVFDQHGPMVAVPGRKASRKSDEG